VNVVCFEWSVMNGLLWTGLFWMGTETENWTFVVWGSWNKPICVLGCYTF